MTNAGMDPRALVPVPAVACGCGSGFGLAVSPALSALGLLVTSSNDDNTLHVFAPGARHPAPSGNFAADVLAGGGWTLAGTIGGDGTFAFEESNEDEEG
jgi:hypothetical protein